MDLVDDEQDVSADRDWDWGGHWAGGERSRLAESMRSPSDLVLEQLHRNDPSVTCLIVTSLDVSGAFRSGRSPLEGIHYTLPGLQSLFYGLAPGQDYFSSGFYAGWPGPALCEALRVNTVLSTLIIIRCPLDEEQQEILAPVIAGSLTLKALGLSKRTLVGGWRPELMKAIFRSRNLIRLSISEERYDDSWQRIGEELIGNSTLTCLELFSNYLGEIGGVRIGEGLALNSTLTFLDLYNNQLGESAGVKIGEALAVNSTLTRLELCSNSLGEVGGRGIGEGLAVNSTLTWLDLSENMLGESAGVKIGEALAANSTLSLLNLSDNKFGNLTRRSIVGGFAVNPSLTSLCLPGVERQTRSFQLRNQHNLQIKSKSVSLFHLLLPVLVD